MTAIELAPAAWAIYGIAVVILLPLVIDWLMKRMNPVVLGLVALYVLMFLVFVGVRVGSDARDVSVVSMARTVPKDQLITEADLTSRSVNRGEAGDLLRQKSDAAGRVALSELKEGSTVRSEDLGPARLHPAPGNRAFAVPLDDDVTLSESLTPGDTIDLYVVSNESKPPAVTGLKVLALPDDPSAIVVDATPAQITDLQRALGRSFVITRTG